MIQCFPGGRHCAVSDLDWHGFQIGVSGQKTYIYMVCFIMPTSVMVNSVFFKFDLRLVFNIIPTSVMVTSAFVKFDFRQLYLRPRTV